MKPFREDEIKMALDNMGPFKAPDPDGFQATFFQRDWEIVGFSVYQMVMDIIEWGSDPGEIEYHASGIDTKGGQPPGSCTASSHKLV